MISPDAASSDGVAVQAIERAWVATVAVALIAIGGLGILFWREALAAYSVWVGSTAYNHCFLVLPLVGYMIWERRSVLLSTAPSPQFGTLVFMPILSAVWLLTTILGVHEAQQFMVLTVLEAALLSILGWGAYKRLLAPLLYLYFLVPSGEFLVPPLQDFTASFAVSGLRMVGVPVLSDGIFIEVPAGTFVIAEACAGLRFLIAAIAFGVFFAIITYKSWVRRGIFIGLSVVVPIFANGLRAFGIIYAAQLINNAAAATADHIIYGWGFFSVILLLLIIVGRSFADRRAKVSDTSSNSVRGFVPLRSALAGFLGVGLASLGPVYAAILDHQSFSHLTRARPPDVAAPWQPVSDLQSDWTPTIFGADRTILDVFHDGDVTVYRFVALYVARGRVNNLIRSQNRVADEPNWRISATQSETLDIQGQDRHVNLSEIVSGRKRRLVVSFYAVDGIVTSSVLAAKIHQVRDLFRPDAQVSAFVAIATDMPDAGTLPAQALTRFLDAMEPMPAYLAALAR